MEETGMSNRMTRRKFMGKTGSALAVGGAGVYGGSTVSALGSAPRPAEGVNYYEKLGVRPFINAAGTYTVLSASTMPEEVQAAVSIASKHPVQLEELLRASGEYLAKRLQCEAALVTAGAASALTLGTAACITLGNANSIVSIPLDMTGLKNEVIVQKTHRYEYDHALRNCGIRFVEVETLAEYDAAFNRTLAAEN
jgi:L-seryl-tRNA(Ser) seleniumtransferase